MPTSGVSQAQRPVELGARRAPRPAPPCRAPSASASRSPICASSRQAAISRMQSAPIARASNTWYGVDDEVLAQHRQRRTPRAPLQVRRRALEERRVGEHAQAGGAVPLVAGGDLGRHEVLAQHALARARLLDLGDHRRAARVDPRAQRADEVALRRRAPRRRARIAARSRCASRRRDLVALDGDDAFEDVGSSAARTLPARRERDELVELGARRADGDRLARPRDAVGIVGATFAAYSAAPALSTTMSRAAPGSSPSTDCEHRLRLAPASRRAAPGCSPSSGRSPRDGSRTRAPRRPSARRPSSRRRARPRPCRPCRRRPWRARRRAAAARAPGCRPGRDGTRPSGCWARRPDW